MISNEQKKLAQWAMEYALKQGCRAAKVTLYTNSNTSFELRDAKIDRLQQASEKGLALSLYVDGRYGNYSTNRLDKKELESFIRNGIASTRFLAPDEYRVLPDASRIYQGGLPDLQLFDERLSGVDPDTKVALARAVAEEALGKDARIISVESSYGDGESASYRLMSNGFEGESRSTWCSLGASVSIKGEGEARPSGGWYENALFYNQLPKTNIGSVALARTLRKLGQSIASNKLTLQDDPHVVGANGSRYFDNEGVATRPRPIIEEGILRTYFIDTYNGKKMDVEATISTPSRLVMQLGAKTLDQLIADIPRGILVTGMNGGNSNSSTGDFSYGIEGFLIEQGKLTQPVSEMNVTGNFLSLWNALAAVGNDPRPRRSWMIPSLVFEGVNFSGL
jgi:PmbA protein